MYFDTFISFVDDTTIILLFGCKSTSHWRNKINNLESKF